MAGGGAADAAGPPPQAGILEGVNPIAYTPSNPITLFIIQASHNPTHCTTLPSVLDPTAWIGAGIRVFG